MVARQSCPGSKHDVRGVVAAAYHDHTGNFLGSSFITLSGITVVVLETLACWEAQALANDLMAQGIVISLDSNTVIKDIQSRMGGVMQRW